MEKRHGILAALGLAFLLATVPGPVAAGKAKPAPVDGGEIYLRFDWTNPTVMNPDGTGRTGIPVFGVPTDGLHGDQRWFLAILPVSDGGTYPTGDVEHALFAVNESDTASVQLTGSPDIQPDCHGTAGYPEQCGWAVESGTTDGRACFVGWRWAWDPADRRYEVVEMGFYVVSVDWAALTSSPATYEPVAPTFLDAVPVVDSVGQTPDSEYIGARCLGFDWSPDGGQVVYARGAGGDDADLWIATADGSTEASLLLADASRPCWSSMGRIAYQAVTDRCIRTMAPDGSDVKTVVPAPRRTTKCVVCPDWSPNGTDLVYLYIDMSPWGSPSEWVYDAFRVAADGSGNTNLTADTGSQAIPPIYWRP